MEIRSGPNQHKIVKHLFSKKKKNVAPHILFMSRKVDVLVWGHAVEVRVADEDQISKIIYNFIFCSFKLLKKKNGLYVWIALYMAPHSSTFA